MRYSHSAPSSTIGIRLQTTQPPQGAALKPVWSSVGKHLRRFPLGGTTSPMALMRKTHGPIVAALYPDFPAVFDAGGCSSAGQDERGGARAGWLLGCTDG
jgi:hypothetical protein